MRALFRWIETHERHLSAAAMVVGFVFDNLLFGRVDHPITHIVFLSYLVIAAGSIAFLHYREAHAPARGRRLRYRAILPIITQFMFGGLWSALLIFYSRSATLATSWPFLLMLGGIFLGNEIFKKYHDQLVFNAVLYFFALYSYFIFAVPVVTKRLSTGTFLLSGVLAVAVFALFMLLLRKLGRGRVTESIWPIRFWCGILFILLNAFYFLNILPPLPLALSAAGIYHSASRVGSAYVVSSESEPWYTVLGINPTLHTTPTGSLYAYSAVFAPIDLNTKIVHVWQWYDGEAKEWVPESTVSFTISGGREGGYRVYSIKNSLTPGKWRVDITTPRGGLIGRIGFTVVSTSSPVPTTSKTLR